MNKKEIKKQIIESILEEKELISSIMNQINQDSELLEYYQEMKALLSNKDDQAYDPGDEYFEKAWKDIEQKISTMPKIIPFYQTIWFKSAAAILIIGLSFFLGTLQQEPPPAQVNVASSTQDLKSLFRKYNVTLTSFVNMEEYESHELLKAIVASSEELLDETRALKETYASNSDVYELLSELERILFAIAILKDQNASEVRIMQYRLQSEIGIDAKLKSNI